MLIIIALMLMATSVLTLMELYKYDDCKQAERDFRQVFLPSGIADEYGRKARRHHIRSMVWGVVASGFAISLIWVI